MMSVAVPRRWANLVLFLTFLALAMAAFSVTGSFPSPLLPGYPGSAMFPRLILVVMACISAFGVLRGLLAKRGGVATDEGAFEFPLLPFLAVAVALCGFALALHLFGAEVAIFAFVGGALWLRTRRPLISAGAGVLSVLVIYLLFVQVLSVYLPLQFLPRYLF